MHYPASSTLTTRTRPSSPLAPPLVPASQPKFTTRTPEDIDVATMKSQRTDPAPTVTEATEPVDLSQPMGANESFAADVPAMDLINNEMDRSMNPGISRGT